MRLLTPPHGSRGSALFVPRPARMSATQANVSDANVVGRRTVHARPLS